MPPSPPPSPPRRSRLKWAIYAFISSCVGCIIWAAALAMAGHRKAAVIMAETAGSSLIAFPWLAIFFNIVRMRQQESSTASSDSNDSSTESTPEPSPSDPAPTIHLDTSTKFSLQPSSPSNQDDAASTTSSTWTSFYDGWPPFSTTRSKLHVSGPQPHQEPDLGSTLHPNESTRSASFFEYLTWSQEPDWASRESHVAQAGIQFGGPTGDEIQLSTSPKPPCILRSPCTGRSVRTRRSPYQSPGASSDQASERHPSVACKPQPSSTADGESASGS